MDKEQIAIANRVRLWARRSMGCLLLLTALCMFSALPLKLYQERSIIEAGNQSRANIARHPEYDPSDPVLTELDRLWVVVNWLYPWWYFVCPSLFLLVGIYFWVKKPRLITPDMFDKKGKPDDWGQ
jgi:hypothetical protein